MPPKFVNPVPGLPLIDHKSLAPAFHRFKNDALYFINNVTYVQSEEAKEAEAAANPGSPKKKSSEAIQRILAVTPQAIFVCDPVGRMDRAVRLEHLDGIVYEVRTVKRVFSKEEQVHLAIKVPSEYDIQCVLEGNKDPANVGVLKSLLRVLETAVRFYKKQGEAGFTTTELKDGQKLEDVVKKERPKDYMSPQEIIAQNQARQRCIDYTEAVNREILELQELITARTRQRDMKAAEYRTLQDAVGGDVKDYIAKKQQLQQLHTELHSKHVDGEVELMRLQGELKSAQETLAQERESGAMLMQQSLEHASESQEKQLEDQNAVRKRAHQREIDKAMKNLAALKAKVADPPRYNGKDDLVKRAVDLEKNVQAAADKWEKEMEQANKLEGYFDAAISDLTLLNEQLQELNDRKREIIAERSQRQAKVAQASSTSGGGGLLDDDDLLGGPAPAAAPSKPPASGGGLLDDDDDLLGGPAPAAKAAPAAAPAAAAGVGLDDDDLLGGGPTTASPPPSAAPAAASAADDLL